MFGDFPELPILLTLLWTAVMFWAGLAWLVYVIFTNDYFKTRKIVESGIGDFSEVQGNQEQLKKLCRRRLTAPFRIWLKGLVFIAIFGFFLFVGK